MAMNLTNDVNKENPLVKQTGSDVNFELKGADISLTIDKVSADSKDWQIVETENYRPDKAKYVEDKWKESFPKQPNLSYGKISSLASRSRLINDWLISTNASYATAVAPPLWLQKEITPDEYSRAINKVQAISSLAADRAKLEAQAAAEYKGKLKKIEKDFNDGMEKAKANDNIAKILTIQSTDLPVSLQLSIDNYTPKAQEGAPDQRAFAREVLTSYRISLIKYVKANPKCDIQEIINKAAGL